MPNKPVSRQEEQTTASFDWQWIKLGLYHGSVHEGFEALSPSINREIGERETKRWCEDSGLDYERRYPRWASKSEDIFFNARRDDSSH